MEMQFQIVFGILESKKGVRLQLQNATSLINSFFKHRDMPSSLVVIN